MTAGVGRARPAGLREVHAVSCTATRRDLVGLPSRSIVVVLGTMLLAVVAMSAGAQQEVPPEVAQIRRSAHHHSGIACADHPDAAWEAALSELAASLQTHVSVNTRREVTEIDGSLNAEFARSSEMSTSLPIHGCRKITWNDGALHCALAYVRRDSLLAGFETYKVRARSLVAEAHQARASGQLADALRGLYWAYLLVLSVPDTCALEVPGTEITEARLALPAGLRAIAEGLSVTAGRPTRDGGLILVPLQARFEGRDVQRLDFEYYRGHGQDYASFRNGRQEVIELDLEVTNLVLSLRHRYPGDMASQPELAGAYRALGEPSFDLRVTVPVHYPWRDDRPAAEPGVPTVDAPAALPRPIQSLLACGDTGSFDRTLDIYRRNGRLQVAARRQDIVSPHASVYLALVDPEAASRPPVLLQAQAGGYVDLRSGSKHTELAEFRGRRVIYIATMEMP